jgi:hypothetical protein
LEITLRNLAVGSVLQSVTFRCFILLEVQKENILGPLKKARPSASPRVM